MRISARLLRHIFIAFCGLAALAVFVFFFARNWAPSRDDYPVQGIDVSHRQGAIDWNRVRADGTDFAYIKASEGADLRDAHFAENWRGAEQAGVKRGAYHFFTLCRLARDQAENFIALVPRDVDALPHALDLEFEGNCSARPARGVILAEIAMFIQMVEAHSEKPMVIYMTKEFEDEYRVSQAIDRSLWLRSLFFPPDYATHPWVMWQASNQRAVDGISGSVDWNVVRQ